MTSSTRWRSGCLGLPTTPMTKIDSRPADPYSSIWTKQRQELRQWLDDNAPSFTSGYVAAVKLIHDELFPARVHLICHLIRDIYRFLPGTLGYANTSRFGDAYESMIKNLVAAWEDHPTPQVADSEWRADSVAVHTRVHKVLLAIVEKSKQHENQPSVGAQLAIALHRSVKRREGEDLPDWIKNSFHKEYRFFVARAHLAQKVDKIPTTGGLLEHFESFERSFHSLIGNYFTGKEELDDILRDTNAPTD